MKKYLIIIPLLLIGSLLIAWLVCGRCYWGAVDDSWRQLKWGEWHTAR